MNDDAPLLDDLMPWSVPSLRLGREWVVAPDPRTLRARWDTLLAAEGDERDALFRPSRARTTRTAVAALPGQRTGTVRLVREAGPCPEPVRLAYGPFDEQWLLPDHRLIDVARPELWRVADDHQLFAVEQPYAPRASGPALLVTAALPDGCSPTGRPGRIRPLYRRPGGVEPNVTPGLLELLETRYGVPVTARDLLAWALAAARPSPEGCRVPLPGGPGAWAAGVALGRRLTGIHLRGARGGDRPRLPGGRRPYVRAALPPYPGTLTYDVEGEALVVGGTGRIAPVPEEAWEFRVGGARMLPLWFERRTGGGEPGTLDAVRPGGWPREWTSELLELITVLALLGGLEAERGALLAGGGPPLTRAALRAAGVLPVRDTARRPASVLDHREEGPEGQGALL